MAKTGAGSPRLKCRRRIAYSILDLRSSGGIFRGGSDDCGQARLCQDAQELAAQVSCQPLWFSHSSSSVARDQLSENGFAGAAASASRPVPAKKPPATVTRSRTGTAPYKGGKVNSWRWPTSGPVTRKYSSSVHKGIDIAGSRGDTVVAVADGKVVYAGVGIVGFGELLIIKHNEVYLSAYGHNDSLLVAEGETVRAGQTIAGKGSSGTDTVKLHFEIRKEGKPIDPQRLLPRR